MDQDIRLWLRHAESDLVAADLLGQGGEYFNALFHLQQAVEKTLKALFIRQNSTMPARLHNLYKLAGQCKLGISREQQLLLDDLTRSYTGSRYPETWGQREDDITAQEVAQLSAATKEFIAWLKRQF